MVSTAFCRSLIFASLLSAPAMAQDMPRPTVDADGTVHGTLSAAPISRPRSARCRSLPS